MSSAIKIKFKGSSLQSFQQSISNYAKNLDKMAEEFCNRLSDIGIQVCEDKSADVNGTYGTHQMGVLVSFKKETKTQDGKTQSIIIGTGKTFEAIWYSYGKEMSGTVNPLLMIEFGSAGLSVSGSNAFNNENHKGELSTGGHQDDTDWWIAEEIDENGKVTKWRKGTAITPTQPMYYAAIEMQNNINRIAKEVFGGK
ncbi:MAG: hypothetical protein KBT03_01435 [Bacteroidales bacterium]|nr:hypothetical protein [Candidatus Scybalousia scybalohippi]